VTGFLFITKLIDNSDRIKKIIIINILEN